MYWFIQERYYFPCRTLPVVSVGYEFKNVSVTVGVCVYNNYMISGKVREIEIDNIHGCKCQPPEKKNTFNVVLSFSVFYKHYFYAV